MLSATGSDTIAPPIEIQAANYAAQQAVNYVARYESSVAAVEQTAANLEQQALQEFSRAEASIEQIVDHVFQQGIFSSSSASGASGQASSGSKQIGTQQPNGQAPSATLVTVPGVSLQSTDTLASAGSPGQTPDTPSAQQSIQASTTNTNPVKPLTTTSGTWTALTNTTYGGGTIGTMLLLSNGDVMAQGGGDTNAWFELTPDASGSYVNGTWSSLAAMSASRLYYASNVLPNGNVFVQGGEYSSAGSLTNTGETYNPVTNTWTSNADSPGYDNLGNKFGDDPSEVLPNGNVLAGYIYGPQTSIYDPSTNTWSQGPTKLNNDRSDEETWVKLPNGDILSYSIFASVNNGNSQAQFYNPNTNIWADTGAVPVQLSSSPDYELGPALLLPDGRVFQLGSNGNTAFYTPSTNSWTAGPSIPDGMVSADAPGAMLPNGDVLFAASQGYTSLPTSIFEFDPNTGVYTNVTPLDSVLSEEAAYTTRMLVLPTGQVLFTDGASNQLWLYTPSGSASSSWQPTISSVANNGDGIFTLTGTRLTGISEGASYGDDAEMSSNYPIVQLTASNGNVYYARTYNWSSTGVSAAGDTTSETVNFTLPSGLPQGTYQLSVVANGIASTPVNFNPSNSSWQPVSLSNYYNETGISDGTAFSGGGLDGSGYELGTPGNLAWQGGLIPYGPANAPDVVSADGQAINLSGSADDSLLTIFAMAVNGDQTDQPFTVEYTNGTSQTFTLSLTNWTTVPGQYFSEIRANELTQYNPNGTSTGTTVYDSGYALPLITDLTVKSITLPDDPAIIILGMGLYHDATTPQAVSLSSSYNMVGISDGTPFSGGGLNGSGYELGTPGNLDWYGNLIPYGPANADDVVNNPGQAINVSAGIDSSLLTIFATAVGVSQTNQPFTVEYTNGTTQTFRLSLSNWTTVPGQYTDEIRANELSQYNSSGTKTGTTVYDSGYALPLITNLTVKSITFPNDPDIDVLGMLLS